MNYQISPAGVLLVKYSVEQADSGPRGERISHRGFVMNLQPDFLENFKEAWLD
ncbi:MAG: hypothetical protein R3C12_19240 [Planctomycetaceae bacterium]